MNNPSQTQDISREEDSWALGGLRFGFASIQAKATTLCLMPCLWVVGSSFFTLSISSFYRSWPIFSQYPATNSTFVYANCESSGIRAFLVLARQDCLEQGGEDCQAQAVLTIQMSKVMAGPVAH